MNPSSSRAIPETPTAIRELLATRGLFPRRRLGQHFLADPNLRDAVIASAGVVEGDLVLEVGPGLGILTKGLLRAGAVVVAAELDRGFSEFLAEAFEGEERFHLVRGDALLKGRLAPEVRQAVEEHRGAARRFLLVANLPYAIATPLFATLVKEGPLPERLVAMVQREVALRMMGRPGERDYGPLAVMLALRGKTRILREIGGAVFVPRAPVASALVEFVPDPEVGLKGIRAAEGLAREAFLHRRKSILKSLVMAGYPRQAVGEALAELGIEERMRPEVLFPSVFVALAARIGDPAD